MSDKNKPLYFVALIPPEPIRSEVMAMKEEVKANYGSKAAMRSPAHITLHMPFTFREDRENELTDFFNGFVASQKPFSIHQKGFGAFEPRVIYIDVHKSTELQQLRSHLVQAMRVSLKLDNADYKNQPFHPHMTIAFRDLKKPMFYNAWPDYQNREIQYEWLCKAIFLLKHTGKEWRVYQEFTFGRNE